MLRFVKSIYYKLRYDLPIWIDNHCNKPYLRIWKHKYWTKTEEQKREAIMRLYELAFGYRFDFDHPRTYNEKIQWLKLYGDLKTETILADKYLVRDFIKEKIGEKYLVKQLGVWDNPDEIDFNALPNQFVLKANHGSGMNLIVRDKSKLDISKAKKKMQGWLKDNFAWYFMELQYEHIPPKIIAEEYLENADDDLYDYKVWCFGGKPYFIEFISERRIKSQTAFYDLKWEKLPFTNPYPISDRVAPKPVFLEELLEVSEKLAQNFPHVRVDFYCLSDGTIKFGEMTFSELGGFCYWYPQKADELLGQLLRLPIDEPVDMIPDIDEIVKAL